MSRKCASLVGEKGGEEKGIRIIQLDTLDDLKTLDLSKNGYQKIQHVKEKWTKYFVSSTEAELIQTIRTDDRFIPFKEYGIINVGITTGNNDYFSITKEIEKQYALESVTLPLIGRSSHAHGIYFTEADWQCNIKAGKKAMLVSFPDIPFEEYPAQHKEYIRLGEETDQHSGYKCTIRNRWYIVPSGLGAGCVFPASQQHLSQIRTKSMRSRFHGYHAPHEILFQH